MKLEVPEDDSPIFGSEDYPIDKYISEKTMSDLRQSRDYLSDDHISLLDAFVRAYIKTYDRQTALTYQIVSGEKHNSDEDDDLYFLFSDMAWAAFKLSPPLEKVKQDSCIEANLKKLLEIFNNHFLNKDHYLNSKPINDLTKNLEQSWGIFLYQFEESFNVSDEAFTQLQKAKNIIDEISDSIQKHKFVFKQSLLNIFKNPDNASIKINDRIKTVPKVVKAIDDIIINKELPNPLVKQERMLQVCTNFDLSKESSDTQKYIDDMSDKLFEISLAARLSRVKPAINISA